MKSGASDPFADQEEKPDQDAESAENHNESSTETGAPPATESTASQASKHQSQSNSAEGGSSNHSAEAGKRSSTDEDDSLSREQLPFVLRRDKVKDERPEVHQLFVQQETHEKAIEAERELEDRLDENLSRTDAREAIYLAGMAQLADAEEILREWGYDL